MVKSVKASDHLNGNAPSELTESAKKREAHQGLDIAACDFRKKVEIQTKCSEMILSQF